MKIYDETTREELKNPDLSSGYLYEGVIVTGQSTEVMPGTITDEFPNGLSRLVDVTEPCQYYHKYREEELSSNKSQDESIDKKISDAVTAAVTLSMGG